MNHFFTIINTRTFVASPIHYIYSYLFSFDIPQHKKHSKLSSFSFDFSFSAYFISLCIFLVFRANKYLLSVGILVGSSAVPIDEFRGFFFLYPVDDGAHQIYLNIQAEPWNILKRVRSMTQPLLMCFCFADFFTTLSSIEVQQHEFITLDHC